MLERWFAIRIEDIIKTRVNEIANEKAKLIVDMFKSSNIAPQDTLSVDFNLKISFLAKEVLEEFRNGKVRQGGSKK